MSFNFFRRENPTRRSFLLVTAPLLGILMIMGMLAALVMSIWLSF